MIDKLIEQAAMVLVIVPQNPNNKEVIAALTSSLANAQSGSSSFSGNAKSNIDRETVAVIAAAASHVLGKAFSIKKIQFVKEQGDSPWTRMGKLSMFTSHEIKRY